MIKCIICTLSLIIDLLIMQFDFYAANEICEILGQRLKHHRLKQNLTQAQLAKEMCISISTVARIESGKGGTIENMLQMAIGLGLINDFSDVFSTEPQTFEDVIAQKNPRQRARN